MCIHLPFMHRKATQSLNYFARKSGGCINKMKAIKLIYFADRYHLRKYGRPITNDEYLAMEYGPVNSGVKDIAEMSDFLGDPERDYASKYLAPADRHDVRSTAEFDTSVFSATDLEALEFAWTAFGCFDQFELAKITHKYPEWKRHQEELQLYSRVRMNYEDFLDDPEDDSEKCYPLTPEDKTDRFEEIREMSTLTALWG
jgi:uncharacterized phage-associated protein